MGRICFTVWAWNEPIAMAANPCSVSFASNEDDRRYRTPGDLENTLVSRRTGGRGRLRRMAGQKDFLIEAEAMTSFVPVVMSRTYTMSRFSDVPEVT